MMVNLGDFDTIIGNPGHLELEEWCAETGRINFTYNFATNIFIEIWTCIKIRNPVIRISYVIEELSQIFDDVALN